MTDKGPRSKKIPPGDNKPRLVCPECDYVVYDNPKIVNAVVAAYQGKILLCRRAIDPRKGYWTLPGGYMENGETTQEGALREAFEEAAAKGTLDALLGIYHTNRKSEVIMVFRMELQSPNVSANDETLEAKLFDWKDIPWKDLAFPFVEAGLKRYDATKGQKNFAPEIATMPPLPPPKAPPFVPPAGFKP